MVEQLSTARGPSVPVVDPASGEPFTEVSSSSAADVSEAVRAAHLAQRSWSGVDPDGRAAVLQAAARVLADTAGELAALLTREQGKPVAEAVAEIGRATATLEYYAGQATELLTRVREVPGKFGYVVRRPLGVVAAITPWNFPIGLLVNKLAPALLAGNAVVVKPAPTTPLATIRFLRALGELADLDGVLQLVLGGREVGEALVRHPDVAKVSFTGSTPTGAAIMEAAGPQVKRLSLELGGSDPMIVDDSADVEAAARAAAISRFYNCGQACIAVKRVFVHAEVAEEFEEALAARVERLPIGLPTDPQVRLGPQHTASQRAHTRGLVEDAVAQGATVRSRSDVPGSLPSGGFFVAPTVLTDVPPQARIWHEECFGPALPVAVVGSVDEAIARAAETPYGLGSSVWTTREEVALRVAEALDTGYTWVNEIPVDVDQMPFGGVRASGFGLEHGPEAVSEFSATTSVVSSFPLSRLAPAEG